MTTGLVVFDGDGGEILPPDFDTRRLVDVLVAPAGENGSRTFSIEVAESDYGKADSVIVCASPLTEVLQSIAIGHTVFQQVSAGAITVGADGKEHWFNKLVVNWVASNYQSQHLQPAWAKPAGWHVLGAYNPLSFFLQTARDVGYKYYISRFYYNNALSESILSQYPIVRPKNGEIIPIPSCDTQVFIFA